MAEPALVIGIVGAESTGKTALAASLAERIGVDTGLRTTWVPEQLRLWCDARQRTPRPEEQAGIAALQRAAVEAAAAAHDVVITDTTPLMTAVYSRKLFGDDSLLAEALAWQRSCAVTLLTALDLPWVPDGLQRDGPHVREPIDDLIRHLLSTHGVPWSLVAGFGDLRVQQALDAVAPALRALSPSTRGLFTQLATRNAQQRPWICVDCDDPDCEHAMRRAT
ncbi:AAA family ATPase [Rubrivivax sp. RP6-9]|uniref:AAA family ATPase n=1 Tax=Rubrivivax sp. RP6-9 TaxID=3415750 RepID=UPI003CC670A4